MDYRRAIYIHYKMRTNTTAQKQITASGTPVVNLDEGFDVHFKFRTNAEVFFLTEHGIKSDRVIRANSSTRSLISTSYVPVTEVTYVLASGIERNANEVFPTREALIDSLNNNNL